MLTMLLSGCSEIENYLNPPSNKTYIVTPSCCAATQSNCCRTTQNLSCTNTTSNSKYYMNTYPVYNNTVISSSPYYYSYQH